MLLHVIFHVITAHLHELVAVLNWIVNLMALDNFLHCWFKKSPFTNSPLFRRVNATCHRMTPVCSARTFDLHNTPKKFILWLLTKFCDLWLGWLEMELTCLFW